MLDNVLIGLGLMLVGNWIWYLSARRKERLKAYERVTRAQQIWLDRENP